MLLIEHTPAPQRTNKHPSVDQCLKLRLQSKIICIPVALCEHGKTLLLCAFNICKHLLVIHFFSLSRVCYS